MIALLHIAGGVALIVHGIRVLRKGLDRIFGANLMVHLQRLGGNRLQSALVGMLVSILSPSSTAVSLLGIQLVRGGSMGFAPALAVLLGASIGLTAMLQLIAFDLYEQAPIVLLGGVLLYQFTRGGMSRGIGQLLLGLGLILLAVGIIRSTAATHVATQSDLAELVEILSRYPWLLLALGALTTFALQSSTATLGLALGLMVAGVVSLDVALPFAIGVDVGLGLTTFVLGYSHIETRRLGLSFLLARAAIAVVLMLLLPWYAQLVELTTPDTGRQLANAHSMFNVICALVWIGPLPILTILVAKMIPEVRQPPDDHAPLYLSESYVDSPALALGQSLREIMRVAGLVESMLSDFWLALRDNDLELCDSIQARDDQVDALEREIKRFLIRAGGEAYGDRESADQITHLRFISDLEHVGDIIDKNLVELARKRIRTGGYFSDEGYGELQQAHEMVAENLHLATTAFATRDRSLARKLIRHEEHLIELDAKLRTRHFERLGEGRRESLQTSAIHLDMLTYFKSINSHVVSAATAILDDTSPGAGVS